MIPKIQTIALTFIACWFLLFSCTRNEGDITPNWYTPEEYATLERSLHLPNHLISYQVELAPHMEFNGMMPPEISDAKALLGRVLFYDARLSRNDAVACASCHKQEFAFADNVAHSRGFGGELTKRNTLALGATANFSSSYGTKSPGDTDATEPVAGFFWDERALDLREQSRQTIEDEIEMGMPLDVLAQKLGRVDYYQVLFRKAYGSADVQEEEILEALEAFVNSLVSHNSRFDTGINRQRIPFPDFRHFSAQENLGKSLFMTHCASCHGSDMVTAEERIANNGLPLLNGDLGVGGISGLPIEAGKFKVPFLRNIAITAPYMHDGRFATLEEVIEHYSTGIEMQPTLDVRFRYPEDPEQPKRLNFSREEKEALVSFLHTLTDEDLMYAERFSDPFIR
ncbi:cytochrome-c peroxidase [Flavilitoribacter nigricans]|uniref:Cytochrome-c peroxidase n=1 Tax=Flavilitoribacter nigricans (strain ATCC 23147 / DSM 23189 / NBRC 102662 / NCIMB 1420 / SS-2) TaxID=1122177 RepID=A0A2D0NEW6_FLAN2|nr:cytochrome c peroxidase [Flavilitoribacter nigricans]PHN07025.1 cytochrome-c peroxidase [Flavilitoribacter nigricans DSM 23189 = NBRC 102662]